MTLSDFWLAHPRAAIAFSGGADSAYLLHSAAEAGADVTAYYVKTELQPQFELDDADRLAAALHVPLRVLERSAIADPQVAANPPDRCYHCKKAIFGAILEAAKADGYDIVVDGTNASDDESDRPGTRALQELQVLSPLRLCGITKAEVRRLSREAGLFTWNKPAYACLATRVPTGTALSVEQLAAVEKAENELYLYGFRNIRVRLVPGGVKLQVPEAQMPAVLARREAIRRALAPLGDVTLDLAPRPEEPVPPPADAPLPEDEVLELRCNLDDMPGEDIAFAAERLLEAGALDVWTTPITMKKGRPAVLLSCLCRPEDEPRMTRLLLRHTTTLGVRRTLCARTTLSRTVDESGPVPIKHAAGPGIEKRKPEFEDLAALARREDRPLSEVRRQLGLS